MPSLRVFSVQIIINAWNDNCAPNFHNDYENVSKLTILNIWFYNQAKSCTYIS